MVNMAVEMEPVDILVETNATEVLNGYLLPRIMNTCDQYRFLELSNIYTSVISDTQASSNALAIAALLRYSKSQAYCLLAESNSNLNHRLLHVQAARSPWAKNDCPNHHTSFQVVEVCENYDDMEPTAVYMIHKDHKARSALDHVVDAALEQALGRTNLELKKNVTIDLLESECNVHENISLWRDRLGFCVGDCHNFIELNFQASHLSSILSQSDSTKYQVMAEYQHRHFEQYDQEITNFARAEYLDFLTNLSGSASRMAYSIDGNPCGLSLAYHTNILAIYAETTNCASQLLDDLLQCYGDKVVTITVIYGGFVHHLFIENQVAHSERHMRRFHTTRPPEIKWKNVFALNVGMHIV